HRDYPIVRAALTALTQRSRRGLSPSHARDDLVQRRAALAVLLEVLVEPQAAPGVRQESAVRPVEPQGDAEQVLQGPGHLGEGLAIHELVELETIREGQIVQGLLGEVHHCGATSRATRVASPRVRPSRSVTGARCPSFSATRRTKLLPSKPNLRSS